MGLRSTGWSATPEIAGELNVDENAPVGAFSAERHSLAFRGLHAYWHAGNRLGAGQHRQVESGASPAEWLCR